MQPQQESCSQITNSINQQMYVRNLPSSPLQPYINCRPVATKYSVLPVVDLRKRVQYPLKQYPQYNSQQTFNPSNDTAPWSGYKVTLESELRNQIFALQRGSQAVYVPNSTSDLYQYSMPVRINSIQDQSLLFQKPQLTPFNPDNFHFNQAVFNNSTRTQLKNVQS
jgi:hypothetical protein